MKQKMLANLNIKKITSITATSTTKMKGVLTPFWKILTFSPADETLLPKKSVSIALEKGVLSVAYGTRFLSRMKVQGVRKYSFEEEKYPPPEGVASSLSLAVNELGAKGALVSLSIPKEWTVIRIAEFPVTVKENLSNAVSYELDRLTPFSSEDALYDFRILKEKGGKLIILIIATRGDLVMPYIEALKENGILVNRVTFNLSSAGALCRYVFNIEDFIFVKITEDNYEGALFLNGFINGAFTGNFATGEETSKIDILKEKVNYLISVIQETHKLPPMVVFLRDKDPALEEMIKLQFNMSVRVLNEKDIHLRISGYREEFPIAAIGESIESLSQNSDVLNFIKRGQRNKARTPMKFTGILILILIFIWMLYLIAPLRIEGKRLEEIDRQLQIRKEDVKNVESLKKEIDDLHAEISSIEDFKENRPMILDILKALTEIVPKNTWLTRVRVSESTVNIEGYATSASTLLPKLEASEFFKRAEFASPTFRDKRMNADRFNIKMEIEGVIQKGKG